MVALSCLAARLWVLFRADYVYDDAFITWRVARHWSEGLGPVFNVGDRVQVTTSLVHVALGAALWGALGGTAMYADRLLACFIDACVAGALAWEVAADQPLGHAPRAARLLGGTVCGVLYICSHHVALVVPSGLETSLYVASVFFSLRSLWHRRILGAAIGSALAALVRPDGLLVMAIVASTAFRRRELGIVIRAWAWAWLPWVTLQVLYYGTVIPQSVAAKSLILHYPTEQWQKFLEDFVLGGRRQALCAAVALVGVWSAVRAGRGASLFVWFVLYVTAICSFTIWWPWYWTPAVAPLAYAVGYGTRTGLSWLTKMRVPAVLLAAVSLVATAWMGYGLYLQGRWRLRALGGMARGYEIQDGAMAAYLRAQTPPEATVLVERLGRVSFATPRRFDDYPGLASRRVTDALRSLGRPIGATPQDTGAFDVILRDVQPSVLLLREQEYRAGINAGILGSYALVRAFEPDPVAVGGGADYGRMLLLQRVVEAKQEP